MGIVVSCRAAGSFQSSCLTEIIWVRLSTKELETGEKSKYIIVEDGEHSVVSDKLLSYLCKELSQIRRTPVIACEEPFSEFSYSPKYRKLQGR